MKKNLILSLLFTIMVLAGCKEDEAVTTKIKIETSGSNYSFSLNDAENPQNVFLSKQSQSGSNVYEITINTRAQFNYNNTGTFVYKIYVNNVLKHEETRGSGSGGIAVN